MDSLTQFASTVGFMVTSDDGPTLNRLQRLSLPQHAAVILLPWAMAVLPWAGYVAYLVLTTIF